MIKKILLTSLATLGLFIAGCGLTDPTEATAPTISGPSTIDTLAANTLKTITVKIEADDTVTFTYQMLNSAGTAASGINVTAVDVTPTKTESKTINFSITNTTATAGSYKLRITATASGLTSTVDFGFIVKGTAVVDTLATAQVVLGAASNANGSSLDVDSMKVYKTSEITSTAIQGYIDIWFAYTSSGDNKLYAPSVAATNGWAPQNWTVQNATTFIKASSVSFSNIKTQAGIDSLWTSSGAATSLAVSAGDVVVVHTVAGDNRLLKIDVVATSTSGAATVTGRIK